MPSHSSITSAEKTLIKKHAASATDKILSGAIGRVYYAYPDPSKWSWAGGLEGAIVFGNTSKGSGGFWFKVVDITVRLEDFFPPFLPQLEDCGSRCTIGLPRCHLGASSLRRHVLQSGPNLLPLFCRRRESTLLLGAGCPHEQQVTASTCRTV